MGDGRALQAGTSHNLGQNFAKAFDITFQARDKSVQHVWGTSWGVTTRLVGAVIMTHGDDSGLILPPRVAPYQVVIVPIPRGNWQETVLPKAREIQQQLVAAGVRVMLDDRDAYTPGWKFAEWELRGVPLRLEIGPKDIEKSSVLVARRDTREKQALPMEGLPAAIRAAPGEYSADAVRSRRAVPRGAHAARQRLRGVQERAGRAARIRHRALVRLGRVRGADQDRHAGDDSQYAAGGWRSIRGVRPVRSAGPGRGLVREIVLTDRAGRARAVYPPAFPAQRVLQRASPPFLDLLHDGVPAREVLALDDDPEDVGQMIAPPEIACAPRRLRAPALPASIARTQPPPPRGTTRRPPSTARTGTPREAAMPRLRWTRADRRARSGFRGRPARRARVPAP